MKRRNFIKSLLATLAIPFVSLRKWKVISVGSPQCAHDPFESAIFDGSGTICNKDANGIITGDPRCASFDRFAYNYQTGLMQSMGPAFASEDGINEDWESPC